jgi:hypothetical protein
MSSERKADGRPRPRVEGFAGPARTSLGISGGEFVVGRATMIATSPVKAHVFCWESSRS